MTAHPRSRTARLAAGLIAAVALALGLVLGVVPGLGGSPAGAHDGDAVITLEAHPAGLAIHYIARVTWANDGHPAEGATVTVTAIGADGTQLTPVPMAQADSDGRYAGVLEYPSAGSWTVRVTSIEPDGTIEQAQDVTPPPATTAPESEVTTAPDDGTAGDGDEAGESDGFAPADDGTGDSEEPGETGGAGSAAEPDEGGGDDGGLPLAVLLAAAAVVIVGTAIAVALMRRNRPEPADSTGDPAPNGSGGTSGAGTTPSAGVSVGAEHSDAPTEDGAEGATTPGGGAPGDVSSTPAP